MGKLNMNLLRGVEEQESAIDSSKAYQKEDPGQLKGATVRDGLPGDAPQAPQKPQTALELSQPIENTSEKEKAVGKANTRTEKQTFSFRAEQNKIESWKLYAETIGTKDIGTLWTAAIDEYITNHGLTADQQAVYDLKKKAAELQRKQSRL